MLAIDNSPEVEEVDRANAEAHGVADRIEFHHGDLFDPLDEDVEADVISATSPECRTPWPR